MITMCGQTSWQQKGAKDLAQVRFEGLLGVLT